MTRRKPAHPPTPTPDVLAPLIASWFTSSARQLPWRVPPSSTSPKRVRTRTRSGAAVASSNSGFPPPRRDPFHALVAEAMLQQTQVARVIPKYLAFVERFPDPASLAAASEDDVLTMWDGLGYYRRAKNLHAAAKLIVDRFSSRVPHTVDDLLTLPGVGRYTAGAIASIAFNQPAPIVDGNVARVLMRLFAKRSLASDARALQPWLWSTAESLAAHPAAAPALVNEGLMELGATVCLPPPASPLCDRCPLAQHCLARAQDLQNDIPLAKTRATRSIIHCAAVILTRPSDHHILLCQRPPRGMWARLWQVPTLEHPTSPPTRADAAALLALPPRALTKLTAFDFLATHRRLSFTIYHATTNSDAIPPALPGARFVSLRDAQSLPLSSPQKRILSLATAEHKSHRTALP